MTELLNAKQAAEYLGCHPTTIVNRVNRGVLLPSKVKHQKNRVRFYFTKARLDAFVPSTAAQQGAATRRDSVTAVNRDAYRGEEMPLDYTVRGLDRWLKAREKRIAEQGGRRLTW